MTVSKEIYVDLHEKYNKMLKLFAEDSKFDPPDEPFISKYAARQILIDMQEKLENLLNTTTTERLKVTGMLAVVYIYLGLTSIDTDELSNADKYFQQCYDLIKDYLEDPKYYMISLHMYNQLGILWYQRDPEKSKIYLEKAENLYCDYIKTGIIPIDFGEFFNLNNEEQHIDKTKNTFEKMYTLTLYYLAQVYGALKNDLKSAIYCHTTLQRQLEFNDYDYIDWALNAATLSQFFMEKNGFKQARHHLAASSYILDEYEKQLETITDRNEEYEAKIEEFRHRSADVARCWAKYGLILLSKSKERLLHHTEDINEKCTAVTDLTKINLNPNDKITLEDLQNLNFKSLNLKDHEKQITDVFVLTLQDAKPVFLNIQSWLNKAEIYYTLETQASDYIEIMQDQTQMYLNLLFFEDNIENQAKLHKRRIDIFENVINKINSQYYLQYCRQIWFDLGQTYFDILNIKLDKLKEMEGRPSAHMLSKINHLTDRSIYYFNCFIDSFREGCKKELPMKITEVLEKVFLQAYFHIAALHSRFITLDKNKQLTNIEASLEAYKHIVDYCQENKKASEVIPLEYNVCKDMVALLPLKIAKLKQEM